MSGSVIDEIRERVKQRRRDLLSQQSLAKGTTQSQISKIKTNCKLITTFNISEIKLQYGLLYVGEELIHNLNKS